MNYKKIISGLLFLVITLTTSAQNLVWYFGASDTRTTSYGLDFTGNGASQRNFESVLDYYESVTVVSDNAGTVLFYSDGIEVFDGSHTKMSGSPATLNGTADGPSGSSVQGAFSMLRPGSTDEYYLFTSQAIDGLPSGLRVNRIDMSLPGNGNAGAPLGEMVTSDSLLQGTGCEMMTAYGVCGSDTVWIITHLPNSWNFVRVLVTSGGIQSVNTQNLPTPRAFGAGFASALGRGSMDINSDGTQLIFTGQNPIGTHLLDFDKNTGLLSNPIELLQPNGFPFDGYGSEFSPDGTKAYFTSNLVSGMWQYDLNTGISTAMPNSAITHGEIITGVNDTLYVGKVSQNFSQTVGTISNPNAAGAAANYDRDAITFPSTPQSAISYAMPQGFFCPFDPDCEIDSVAQACTTDPAFQFTANVAGTWGGGAYINASGMFDPSVAGVGTHWITFDGGCPEPDSVQMVVVLCCPNIDPNLGADITICDDLTSTLDAGSGFASYEWKENGVVMSGTGSTIAADSGTYVVNVTDGAGCTGTDTIEIGNHQLPVVNLGPAASYCATDSIQLDAGSFVSYVWTPNGETSQQIWASAAATYAVTVTDANGCEGTDNVVITENTLPTPSVTGNTIVCQDSTTLITGVAGSGGTLSWSGITPFTNPLAVTAAGTYTIIETDGNGCIDSTDYTLTLENLPSVNLAGPYVFCDTQGNQVLDASTGASNETYVWSDGSSNATLNVTTASTVSVIVTSQNGCIALDTAIITTHSLPVVNLGPDTFFCELDSFQLDAGSFASYVWTPNVGTGQTVYATSAGNYAVTVTDANGCTATDDVDITQSALPVVGLNPTASYCVGDSVELDAGAGFVSYTWTPNNETSSSIFASTAGQYSVVVVNANGCVGMDTVVVSEITALPVDLGVDTFYCEFDSVRLDVVSGYTSYEWTPNISTTETGYAKSVGTYSIIVTDASGCKGWDTVEISMRAIPIVNLGPDTFYCAADSFFLDAGAGFTNYTWTPNVGTGQTVYANTQTNYSVTVTDVNGCSATNDVNITENALPTINLGADTTVCEADSITLNATHVDAASYAWTPNSETQAIIKVGSSAATYGVTVTDVDGCTFTDSRTISQDALPVVNLGANDTICDDLTKTLDASAGYSYIWYLDGNVMSDTTQTIDADSGTYVVSVTTALGCESRDTILVDNHQLPVVSFTSNFEFCELDSVQLDAGNAPSTYSWSPTGETTQTIWATQPGTFTATVTDVNGCINSGDATVIENSTPPVNLGANDSACVGLSITLDATVPNGVTYDWSDGHNQSTYTITNPDTLSVIVTDANGCIGYDTIEIKMLQQLNLQFDDTTTECANDILDLDAGNYAGGVYSWTLPDGSIDNSQIITLNDSGLDLQQKVGQFS